LRVGEERESGHIRGKEYTIGKEEREGDKRGGRERGEEGSHQRGFVTR
jgi:hypothetical protein